MWLAFMKYDVKIKRYLDWKVETPSASERAEEIGFVVNENISKAVTNYENISAQRSSSEYIKKKRRRINQGMLRILYTT